MTLNNLFKRAASTLHKNDIGRVFIQDNVQKMLKDISRFDDKKIFKQRQVKELRTPRLMFMSDEQLERAKNEAYNHAQARLQMPPVMAADISEPPVLSRDEEIVGYTKFKVMFIDISPGHSDRSRLMSIREPDGTLRGPTHEERSRLNHIFYPSEDRAIDVPKLFEEKNLLKLMERKEYEFVLNRACVQFEPDDPRYVKITTFVYNYIDGKGDYDRLRSTRHFGPMCLYLAHEKRADDLICEMLSKDLVEDATKLVKIYYICHNIE